MLESSILNLKILTTVARKQQRELICLKNILLETHLGGSSDQNKTIIIIQTNVLAKLLESNREIDTEGYNLSITGVVKLEIPPTGKGKTNFGLLTLVLHFHTTLS